MDQVLEKNQQNTRNALLEFLPAFAYSSWPEFIGDLRESSEQVSQAFNGSEKIQGQQRQHPPI